MSCKSAATVASMPAVTGAVAQDNAVVLPVGAPLNAVSNRVIFGIIEFSVALNSFVPQSWLRSIYKFEHCGIRLKGS